MVCCTGATLVASGLGAVASVAGVSEVSSGIGVEAIRLAGGAPGRGPARRAGRLAAISEDGLGLHELG